MDYEQKYKEALKWMQGLYSGLHGATKEEAERYFPELKESEGERIRKEIIQYIKTGTYHKDWVAWLEKQNEPKDKEEISTSVNVQKKKATGVLGEMIANINPESLQKTKEQMIAEVEQQIKGCIGMILTDVNERRFEDFGVTLKECLEWLEKQGEQKPTDKTEPRFKVGDWITHDTANFVFKIINVGSDGYEVVNRENDKKTISFYNEDKYHLWTIQDAKDGDVLVNSEGYPFVFSGKYDEIHFGNPIAYCGVTCENKFKESSGIHWTSKNGVTPAIKRQCEFLFQKMKEAGYEWDNKHKRLILTEI